MQHSLKKWRSVSEKRIKTRRLTNIYHSDDDDVGDGSNLLSSLSLSLSLFPRHLSAVCAKIFEHGVMVALAIGYSQKRDFSNITVIIRV